MRYPLLPPPTKLFLLSSVLTGLLLAAGCDSTVTATDNDSEAMDNNEDTGGDTDTGEENPAGTDTGNGESTPDTDNITDGTDITVSIDSPVDIYNAIFLSRSADCGDYVNEFDADPLDIKNDLAFNADVVITASESECIFTSNSVPNHDFNDETAAFAGGTEGATITATEAVHIVTRILHSPIARLLFLKV